MGMDVSGTCIRYSREEITVGAEGEHLLAVKDILPTSALYCNWTAQEAVLGEQ